MSREPGELDRAVKEVIDRMRRKQLMGLLEVLLGDLVELDGIEATKEVLAKFQDQLEYY